MRVNVYTEEFDYAQPEIEIVTADYTNSRTNAPMTNYGVRFYLKSAPELHTPPNDDDRSAVTFWCGPNPENMRVFLEQAFNRLDALCDSLAGP